MNKSFALIFILFYSLKSTAISIPEISNGQHSFQTLGDQFSIPVPVKKIDEGKLILFNYDAAKRLGLDLPNDPKELEKMILDNFGYFVDTAATESSPTRMATYYLDSAKKAPGEALGDGRALWLGEIKYTHPSGKKIYLDVVAKGTGPTPLAWTSNPGHNDGLQAIQESVSSFILSETNNRNSLETTTDLAVIKLPHKKANKYIPGATVDSAITIRVGPQFRIAHLRYHDNDPKNFKKVMNYIVNRELGRDLTAEVTKKDVTNYLTQFASKIGEQSAQYTELHAVHGSPTLGNRTTGGLTIDMGTFRYLNAQHENFTFLFNRLKLKNQNEYFFNYIDHISEYMNSARYEFKPSPEELKQIIQVGKDQYKDKLSNLYLERIGLNETEISKLSPTSKDKFFQIMEKLLSQQSLNQAELADRKIIPAAYDIRSICEKIMETMNIKDSQKRTKAMELLFVGENGWASPNKAVAATHQREFEESINKIIFELDPQNKIDLNWIWRAKNMNQHQRPFNKNIYQDKYASFQTILDKVSADNVQFDNVSREALNLSDIYTDSPSHVMPRAQFNYLSRKNCLDNALLELLAVER